MTIVRIEPGRHPREIAKVSDQRQRECQQRKRQGSLHDNQPLREPACPDASRCANAFVQRGIRRRTQRLAREVPGWPMRSSRMPQRARTQALGRRFAISPAFGTYSELPARMTRTRTALSTKPAAAPSTATNNASARYRNARSRRAAPSATRTAVSRARVTDLASNSVATFAHAISRSRPAPLNSRSSVGRMLVNE